ncbi:MAG: uroporphyrinogen decarboxylase family protein [Actinobacteria bacterium]|nr:uroporphyrinogen decarboxylase family protein [Actinomycetota bacterium]
MDLIDWVRSFPRRVIIPVGGLPGAALSGTTVRSNMCDGAVKAASAVSYVEEYGPDAVFHIGDVAVEAEAMGVSVGFPEENMPEVLAPLVREPGDIHRLRMPDFTGPAGRTGVDVECVRLLAQRFPQLPVFAQVTGPFTIASALVGHERACRLTVTDRPFLQRLLDVCTEVTLGFARAQLEAGGTILWIGEPMGSLLSPSTFAALCVPPLQRIVAACGVMSILHVCGNTSAHLRTLADTGVQGLSLDSAVDLPTAARALPGDVVLMGNIHPVAVARFGTPDSVRAAADTLLDAMDGFDNFILSTGCSTPVDSPPENIKALIAAARERPRALKTTSLTECT